MDRSGAMPRSAWWEMRDEHGELLATVQATIDGGTVWADVPPFPDGMRGTIVLRTDDDEGLFDGPEITDLPTARVRLVAQLA